MADANIQEELWNIFTYYSLHGNPRDPSRINAMQFLKLCRESQLFDEGMVETPLTQSVFHVLFTLELKKVKSDTPNADRLGFNEFLSCLVQIALKVYPSNSDPEAAMQQLLMDNVLPLPSRRIPTSIKQFIKQDKIQELKDYYEEALMTLFLFFASAAEKEAKTKLLTKKVGAKSFDELRTQYDDRHKLGNSQICQMSHDDFMRFTIEFGMGHSMGLTTLDVGDIYLSVIAQNNFQLSVRKIVFDEFWEMLVALALKAFSDLAAVKTEDKVKGLFLHMWRYIDTMGNDKSKGIQGFFKGGPSVKVQKHHLIRGSQMLNDRFVAAWAKDDHRDYLDCTQPAKPTDGSQVLRSLMRPKKSSKAADTAADGESASSASSAGSKAYQTPSKSEQRKGYTGLYTAEGTPITLHIDIDDSEESIGDERLKVEELKLLLQRRPQVALLLHTCIEEGKHES